MTSQEEEIAEAIEAAEEILEASPNLERQKPRLLVENCNPDRTVLKLRNILAAAGGLFDRGLPVRLYFDQLRGGFIAHAPTPEILVLWAHTACRPYVLKKGEEIDVGLPRRFAVMYLDLRGGWQLQPLNGIATAPLLQGDGTINSREGYDMASGLWCEKVPDLSGFIPERPTNMTESEN